MRGKDGDGRQYKFHYLGRLHMELLMYVVIFCSPICCLLRPIEKLLHRCFNDGECEKLTRFLPCGKRGPNQI